MRRDRKKDPYLAWAKRTGNLPTLDAPTGRAMSDYVLKYGREHIPYESVIRGEKDDESEDSGVIGGDSCGDGTSDPGGDPDRT